MHVENGALLTMLLPFNIGFYRRMGYGFGGKLYEYHLPTGALPRLTERCGRTCACCSRRSLTRRWTASGALPPETMAWWRSSTRSCAEPGGYSGAPYGLLRRRTPVSYAAYRFESASACNYTQNRLSVEELVYENGTVLRALLGGLRMQEDLAQRVILRTGEEDFHHLLDDPQDVSGNYIDYGFLQTNVSAVGTMFKLTDGADFVRRTGYRNFPAGTLTAAFRYRDEMADRGGGAAYRLCRWPLGRGRGDRGRDGDLPAGGIWRRC